MSYPTIFNVKTPTARKEHQCCECPTVIKKGERYVRSSGLWEDDFLEFKQCQNCADIFNACTNEMRGDDNEPHFTCLCFFFHDNFFQEESIEEIAKKLKLPSEKVREFYPDWGEE